MRIVITGGPSVGKTTIVTGVAGRGFPIVHEFATEIIKEGVLLPWVDRCSFQNEVLRRQCFAEKQLSGLEGPVFLDRGLFDGEAYYIYDKLEIPEIFSQLDSSQYSLAFLVELLPFFDKTDVRRENLEFTREISVVLENCYTSRGVEVVRVPAMAPTERVDFVIAEVLKRLPAFKTRKVTAHSNHLHVQRRSNRVSAGAL
ncbi:MAG: ATP-binding protein [Candidatus Melainabacteria bacterium]|nr:ATP-binding protein [Candidatus Melainabacteria bacterium]